MRSLDVLLGPITYRIQPVHHPLAERWLDAVADALRSGFRPEPNFCFLGFPQGPRTLEVLCAELASHIGTIRAEFPSYEIDAADFTPLTMRYSGGLRREATNLLHRHFEFLQGPTGETSLYYTQSPPHVQDAICRLNWLCHEIESRVAGEHCLASGQFDDVSAAQITTFHGAPTFELADDDFSLHTTDREPGDVFLCYPIVGKTALTALNDEDIEEGEDVERFVPHTLGSASFEVEWGRWAAPDRPIQKQRRDDFAALTARMNIDPRQHGFIKIGRVDLHSDFQGRTFTEIQTLLAQHLRITGMRVVHDGEVVASMSDEPLHGGV